MKHYLMFYEIKVNLEDKNFNLTKEYQKSTGLHLRSPELPGIQCYVSKIFSIKVSIKVRLAVATCYVMTKCV